jgi:hypothetical protein
VHLVLEPDDVLRCTTELQHDLDALSNGSRCDQLAESLTNPAEIERRSRPVGLGTED